MAAFELFHEVADPQSARVRRFVSEHSLGGAVRFRNLFYPEVHRDFLARGGRQPPALWDGQSLLVGAEAILARLEGYVASGI